MWVSPRPWNSGAFLLHSFMRAHLSRLIQSTCVKNICALIYALLGTAGVWGISVAPSCIKPIKSNLCLNAVTVVSTFPVLS